MLETLRWLLVVEFISFAALPVVLRAFPNLSDRGWGLSRPVAMILLGTITWLLSYAHILPNTAFGWWLIAGLISAGSGALAFRDRDRIRHFVRTRWRLIVVSELIFLGFFALVILLRAFMPNIQDTEKPMELMLLNSAVQAPNAPPEDAWLSGYSVSYYYFGYWIFGGLSTMAGVATEYAFNLSLALISGAAAAAVFTIASTLVRRDGGSYRASVIAGVGATFLLLFVASLAGWWELAAHLGIGTEGFYQWLRIDGLSPTQDSAGWRPDQHWWWFRASRVINSFDVLGNGLDFTIEEFPSFSFILGDLHPHVISMPFVLTGIGVAANIFFSEHRWGLGWLRANPWPTAIAILVVGASGFVNAWDILFLFTLVMAVASFKVMKEQGCGLPMAFLRAAPALVPLGAAAILLYSPYYFGTLESQVQESIVGPVKHGTRIVHFLTVWGGPIVLSATFLAVTLRTSLKPQFAQTDMVAEPAPPGTRAPWSAWWLGIALVAVPYVGWYFAHLNVNAGATAGDLLTRAGVAGPLGVLFIALLATLAWRASRGANDSAQFVLILAALCTYMLFGAELLFVHDLFGNRMNTVFKLYYEVWIAASLIAAFGAYYWWRVHPRLSGKSLVASRTVAVLAAVLAVGPLYYPVAAAFTRADEFNRQEMTIDGLAWLRERSPDEYAAIEWLRDNATDSAVIAESVGGSYSEHARISEVTGLPTVIGWLGHEDQWRSEPEVFAGRSQDVRDLYESPDVARTEQVIDLYNIRYVVVGQRERSTYPGLDASKFDTLGDRAFEQGGMVIYRLR